MQEELPFWSWLILQFARMLQWAMKWVWDHIRSLFEQLWSGFENVIGTFDWLPPLPDMAYVSSIASAVEQAGFPVMLSFNLMLAYLAWRTGLFVVRMTYVLIKLVRGGG